MAAEERNGLSLDWARAVTVDWDKPFPPDWVKGRGRAARTLKRAEAVYMRESGTKGFHVVVVRREERGGFSLASKFQLRALLGDDGNRLSFDRQRYRVAGRGTVSHRRIFRGDYATGVLFDFKDGRQAGPWRKVR